MIIMVIGLLIIINVYKIYFFTNGFHVSVYSECLCYLKRAITHLIANGLYRRLSM